MRFDPKPCILFGNGMLKGCEGSLGWYEFLEKITTPNMKEKIIFEFWNKDQEGRKKFSEILEQVKCPAPLLAVLVTEDSIDTALKKFSKEYLTHSEEKDSEWNVSLSPKDIEFLKKVLDLDVPNILTTNYTYDLEMAHIFPRRISRNSIKQMQKHTIAVSKSENKYNIHTYMDLQNGNSSKKLWHIHGDIAKPGGMILGHYLYSKNIYYLEKDLIKFPISVNNFQYDEESWLKIFLLSDVYCIGFGFELSEHDMWWLLNRKARERENCGKVYFYEPEDKEYIAKTEIMKIFKNANGENLVEVINLKRNREEMTGDDWKDFYLDVICDIKKRLAKKKAQKA